MVPAATSDRAAGTGVTEVTYFAAVAAVRIQSWLARTPDLRYVRGASEALTRETSREALARHHVLPSGVLSDPDTTDVAGVCVLRSDDAGCIDQAIDLLVVHLQARLPGVEWTAWRAEAPSYVVAYDTVNGSNTAGGDVVWWPRRLPVALHLPFAAACARCAHEIAVDEVPSPGGRASEGVGPDCTVRYDAGANSEFKDFDALAKVGAKGFATGRRDAANHLATICADGNRVGAFFTAVATMNDPAVQAALSNALDQAARGAAAEAAACGPNGDTVAMTHFVGGDDIFASVAAPFAWQYVETLSRVFEAQFRDGVARALEAGPSGDSTEAVRLAAAEVSLGIGVAFAHAKHPIADSREAALKAETHAKRATQGRAGAASWLDITVEPSVAAGSGTVPAGRWVLTSELAAGLGSPHPVLVLDASPRKTLEALLRVRDGDTPAQLADAVRSWARRVDLLATLEPYLPDRGQDGEGHMVETLRHTVDRARWWPQPEDTDQISEASR